MNPQNNEVGMQLPPPVMEQGHAPQAPGEAQPTTAEQPAGPQFAAMPVPTSIPLPTSPTMPGGATPGAPGTTNATASVTADDSDLIEKQWVLKAKAIVDRTAEDPYKQSEELTAVKADYMKQRYNKTIKLNK